MHEDNLCMAFRDIAPVAPFHAVVIPKARIARLTSAKPEVRPTPFVVHVLSLHTVLEASAYMLSSIAVGNRAVLEIHVTNALHMTNTCYKCTAYDIGQSTCRCDSRAQFSLTVTVLRILRFLGISFKWRVRLRWMQTSTKRGSVLSSTTVQTLVRVCECRNNAL